jgi:type I restriction enzyme S subunit
MSFPRYPAYKPSGVEWLGEVPEHWDVLPIKRIASLQSGTGITADSITGEGPFPVYGGNGVRGYTDAITHEGHFPIIGRQGALCGNVNYARGAFWASEHAVVVTPCEQVEVRWLGETLRAMNLNQYSVSAAQPGLSVEAIINLFIPRPPTDEQIAISTFLDRETAKIDALIAEQQRLIELLQEKRQAVISHAVTKGLNPDAPMKDLGVEWLGEVPEHWEVTPLKHLATVQTGIAKGKDLEGIETVDVPYLRVANVQDGYLDLGEVHLLSVPITSIARYLLKDGDVLMNEGGDFDKLGRGCIWSGEIESCVHQNHVFAVRPHSVSGEWLNAYTTSKAANSYFISRSKQSTNLASISSSNLMVLSVPLPPAEEVREILVRLNELVEEIDDLKQSATQATDLLQERRSALISAAVTGQIDVRGLVPEASAA